MNHALNGVTKQFTVLYKDLYSTHQYTYLRVLYLYVQLW